MPAFKIEFKHHCLEPINLSKQPVLIIGNIKEVRLLQYENVARKLQNYVTKDVFDLALRTLQPNPTDVCSLYLDFISVAAFADNATHYNSLAQPHLLSKVIRTQCGVRSYNIVLVCQLKNAFASGCAVAKSFSVYNKKSFFKHLDDDAGSLLITIEFLLVESVRPDSLSIVTNSVELNTYCPTLETFAKGIQLASRIVDTPCNEMNVDHFISEIEKVGRLLNIEPLIIRGEDLRNRGFGGLYCVGKAAVVPPALVVLSFLTKESTKNIAWVGKGIVYDTGGLCVKTRASMPGMKRDCGGAAALLGAFYAAISRGFTQNLHAVFCLAENSVGPNATRPDDIYTLYSGKTVEVNNTDAEGRLVLADGVAYAELNLKADIIVDIATLTGAQSISTGKYHAAVMSNQMDWEQLTVQSGLISGDLAFPIPYCPELYFNEFNSMIADMKNSVSDRTNALSSCAGLFIISQLGFDTKISWVHIDIASVAYLGERATGYGVALLNVMFGYLSKDSVLKGLSPYESIMNPDSSNRSKRMRVV